MIIIGFLFAGSFAFQQSMRRSPILSMSELTTSNLDQSQSLCPKNTIELYSLKFPTAKQTKIQFHNSASDIANVFWHDYKGIPSFKAAIPTNGYLASITLEGHAFRVFNNDLTTVLLDFRVGRRAVGFGGQRNMNTEDISRPISQNVQSLFPDLDWDEAREVGFVNRMSADVDLY